MTIADFVQRILRGAGDQSRSTRRSSPPRGAAHGTLSFALKSGKKLVDHLRGGDGFSSVSRSAVASPEAGGTGSRFCACRQGQLRRLPGSTAASAA